MTERTCERWFAKFKKGEKLIAFNNTYRGLQWFDKFHKGPKPFKFKKRSCFAFEGIRNISWCLFFNLCQREVIPE